MSIFRIYPVRRWVKPNPVSPLPVCKGIHLFFILLILSVMVSCNSRKEPSKLPAEVKSSLTRDKAKTLRKVKLLPYWVPSAQFAGYYVGIEKGIFRQHGIDLEILPFDPVMAVAPAMAEKKSDFALLWLVNALEIREQGVDIVNIAQLSSRSSLMLITKKSSGIDKIQDMDGKRAGIWIGYEKQPQALFKKYNLHVDIVNIGSTNNLFLQGGVDILNANWFDEYHSVINCGVNEDELNTFFFADYGFNFLEDGIYCLSETAKKDPELCRDFVAATLESWYYAFDHQEESIDVVDKFARAQNQPVNHAHQEWMLSHYRKMYIPEGSKSINTLLLQKDYEEVQKILVTGGFIKKIIPYQMFYPSLSRLQDSR